MKKLIYILSAIALLLLPSCYESEFEGNRMVKDFQTLPPKISDTEISLEGDFGDLYGYGVEYFFQAGRSKDFPQGETLLVNVSRPLMKYELAGTYYYRACAICNNDTVYAPNVESFTVNNEIQLSDNVKIDVPFGYFTFTSTIYTDNAGILISTDKDFKDTEYYGAKRFGLSGVYEYTVTSDYLSPGTTYYVKAIASVLLGTVESNVISFTTEDNRINSVGIYGNGIDGKPITEDLLVVIQNLSTQEWSQPYSAIYNESKKNYEILDFDYTVEPGTWYAAYAVTAKGATWDNSGYVVFGGGKYNLGSYQVPICWGVAEIDGSNPEIKMELRPWTSQVTVEYPSSWGRFGKVNRLQINSDSSQLPGSLYDINTRKSLQETSVYYGRPYESEVLSEDGTKYSFSFYIFPTQITSNDCKMGLVLGDYWIDVPCPNLNIEMGRKYTITFESTDLDIIDVSVKTWEDINGGSITIHP